MPRFFTNFWRRLFAAEPKANHAGEVAVSLDRPRPIISTARHQIGRQIVDFEARRDRDGDVIAYELPHNDGGGTYEFAGINDKYHPEAAIALNAMHKSRREAYAAKYIEGYTLKATGLAIDGKIRLGTLFFVLDTTFNRGGGGSACIVQSALQALGYMLLRDGKWGPVTRATLARADEEKADDIIAALRQAREEYERVTVGVRSNLWQGLVNRWNKAAEVAIAWNL